MWTYPKKYGVIVIGAGHAGCEAAHASAKMGVDTLLLTMSLDTVAKMSCNPAIGGTAKGHMVREIDALGGIMGKIADRTGIQFRMLNASKGPAVWSPRAQSDKQAYSVEMKKALEAIPNLDLKQGTIEGFTYSNDQVTGVMTQEGIYFEAETVIVCSGTFLKGVMHIGEQTISGGRAGDKASIGMSQSLQELGFSLGRLKTGTPPRIHKRSVNFSVMEEQPGDPDVYFSYDEKVKLLPQVSCYITYTTEETKKVIGQNLNRSAMYSGKIHSVGPRYCPSIEDKIVRFADKERHQLFLEPEGIDTDELYVNGISTSLPFDVQYEMLKTVTGLENVEIMRPAYAIEYDYVKSGQLHSTLETKKIKNLFFAGQINGTTGYEEAASQGLIAGINAALKVQKKPEFILKRSEAYIGVMIEEIITKEDLKEPYRMFTSRAEHRLLLRQDNADLRLRQYGFELGLINSTQYDLFLRKKEAISSTKTLLDTTKREIDGKHIPLSQYLRRPEVSYQNLQERFPEIVPAFDPAISLQIELEAKYEGYIQRQVKEISRLENLDYIKLPLGYDFKQVKGLRKEALETLIRIQPHNLGQASRMIGITPADISCVMIHLKKQSCCTII
jgi:tRNA uridine 5-carboxymethylaminomethyl modification enzyme